MTVVVLIITLFMANGDVMSEAVPTHSMEECGDMAKYLLDNPQVKAAKDADFQCITVNEGKRA